VPFRPKAYVEVIAQDIHCRTQGEKWKKDTFTRWDSKLYLCVTVIYYNISFTQHHSPLLDSSCKVTISVLQDRMLGDKCLGKVDIDLERLLERQNLQVNEGECYLIY
jgi:hypothetical protein